MSKEKIQPTHKIHTTESACNDWWYVLTAWSAYSDVLADVREDLCVAELIEVDLSEVGMSWEVSEGVHGGTKPSEGFMLILAVLAVLIASAVLDAMMETFTNESG